MFKSFGFAIKGIKISLLQRNFKIQLFMAFLTIVLGFVFKITSTEWCIILLCCGLVLSLEMVNTAIEHLVDLVSPDFNEKAGLIKDVSAGAVLVAAILSAITGLVIYYKYIIELF